MSDRFRKLASRLRLRKVRSRFFVSMILLSLLPLCLLGYVSFNIAKNTLTENNASTFAGHLQTSSEVADLLFRNIINLNRFIVLNEELRDDLRDSEIKSSQEQSEMNDRTINRLQRIINSNSFDTRYMDSLCLFDLHYRTYCLGRSDDAGYYEVADKKRAIERTEWYNAAFEDQGKVVFFSYNVIEDKPGTFSSVKLFRDSSDPKGEPIGFIVTNLSTSMFESVFGSNADNGSFLAIDASRAYARVVYPEAAAMEAAQTPGSREELLSSLRNQGYLISEFRNRTTEWSFVHIIKESQLLKDSNRIGTATALIALAIFLVALVISYIVSGSITRPLLRLKRMMVDWNKGSREFEAPFRDDEIGAIGETFKRMVLENEELGAKLTHSKLKEREAELRALQAQIKPHFLYNTLDSIYLMARLRQTDKAATMALALSESFKLSLNKGKETIPLFMELQHIEHYMTIQNIRYDDRFRFEVDVDPGILGMEILKLILQPLVENAIYHGLEPKVGKGSVRVLGQRDGDALLFTVEDDGVGMEDAERMEKGYGLRNVRERLLLYYGASSAFQITSKPGEGTRIRFRIKPFPEEVRAHA
ncbi:sensor histidine kinase [Cohnella thailandensis]|uniref:histidine kinase n=1 Tax=Cohnella thailandensis TaxID=557557 RepID=A0A841SLN8_9BACL|nr:histidine kinase [Cohnella thailandensis]MBB6632834.1 sensor histidine kinase [Cohnella thailandensis]MBP1975472.1 two-component system sensor histidine kinase YesM [Cohnella thailandensis]